ncbi:sentrin-specific protease 8-like [Saccoglossus kowalevskii]
MAETDEIVLSFHDSLLRKSDINLLEGSRWLNDTVIGFAFEYFEQEQFRDFNEEVCFISPDVTQFIKLSSVSDIGIFLEPLNLESKKLIFLAVNDNESRESAGGSHWTLLVFDRENESFSHYDSAGSYYSQSVSALSTKLATYVKAKTEVKFVTADSPQQKNISISNSSGNCGIFGAIDRLFGACYDCGLFVICSTEHLCKQLLQGCKISLKDAVTQEAVSRKRDALKTLILSLSNPA